MKWLHEKLIQAGREIMEFVHNYTLEIILLSFIALGVCWAIGYFANAIWGMKFELASCWAGFSAIGGAGVLSAVKYCIDSWKNTPDGVAPTQGMSTSQRLASMGARAMDRYVNGSQEKTREEKQNNDKSRME